MELNAVGLTIPFHQPYFLLRIHRNIPAYASDVGDFLMQLCHSPNALFESGNNIPGKLYVARRMNPCLKPLRRVPDLAKSTTFQINWHLHLTL